jgi:hypothetical protein
MAEGALWLSLRIDDNKSVDESAEATGEWATASPIPNPTASMPSRAIPRVFNKDLSFPQAHLDGCGRFVAAS